jgi:Glycosyl transferase family 90
MLLVVVRVLVGVYNFRLIQSSNNTIARMRQKESQHFTLDPFPRWGDSIGIAFSPLLDAVRTSMTVQDHGKLVSPKIPYETRRTFQKIYIVDAEAHLWGAQVPNTKTQITIDRSRFMEPLLVKTLQAVKNNVYDDVVHLQNAIAKGGLLHVVNYGDAHFCSNDDTTSDNNHDSPLIPVFTLSAPVDCNYAFPIPTYETIIRAQNREISSKRRIIPLTWDSWIYYPWRNRERKAVWRGSPTGPADTAVNLRWRLCELGNHNVDLLDAKFVGTTRRWPQLLEHLHLQGERIDTRDFQRYRAVIDVDGNSWSARFGELLCYSSVVLKIEPRWVDYFYPELQPWQQYIPVQADLSDLLEKIQFAVSDQHQSVVRQIVANANTWCLSKLKEETLMRDMARILDVYAALFSKANASWSSVLGEETTKLLHKYNFTRLDG